MNKTYKILLDGYEIGITRLEYGDASMSVAFGLIVLHDKQSPYQYFKKIFETKDILLTDYEDDEFLSTHGPLECVKVLTIDNIELKGAGIQISGIKDEFEIIVEGVYDPPFEKEFPHHVEAHNDLFK